MRAWVLVLDEVQRGENGVQAIRGLGQLWGAARAPQGVADQGDVRPHIQKLRHRATEERLNGVDTAVAAICKQLLDAHQAKRLHICQG